MSDQSTRPLALMGCGALLAGGVALAALSTLRGELEPVDGALLFNAAPTLSTDIPLLPAQNAMQVPMSRFLIAGASLPDAAPHEGTELTDQDIARLRQWGEDSGDDSIVDKMLIHGQLGYATIEISPTEIRASGQPIVALDSTGQVPEDARRGMMIRALYDALRVQVEGHRGLAERIGTRPFAGELLLFIHPDVPTKTVRQVMYTSGQAEFGTFLLAVDDPTPGETYTGGRGAFASGMGVTKLTVVQGADKIDVFEPIDFEKSGTPDQAAALVKEAEAAGAPLCGIYVNDGALRFSDAAPTLDAMFAPETVQWMVWSFSTSTDEAEYPELAPQPSPQRWSLGLNDTVSVIPITLSRLTAFGGEPPETCSSTSPVASAEPPPRLTGKLGVLSRSSGLGTTGSRPSSVGGDPIILGAIDRADVDRVIKRHMNQIRYCYQRQLNKEPGLAGKIAVKFVIAKDGSVSKAATKSSTMASPEVEQCINSRFMRFHFPEPKGGGIAIVSYPFVFAPD